MITFPECWSHNCMRTYNWKISQCKSVRTKSSGVENMKCNLVLGPKHKLQTLGWRNPGLLHEPQGIGIVVTLLTGRKKWIELKIMVGELEGKWKGEGEISSFHLSNSPFLVFNSSFYPLLGHACMYLDIGGVSWLFWHRPCNPGSVVLSSNIVLVLMCIERGGACTYVHRKRWCLGSLDTDDVSGWCPIWLTRVVCHSKPQRL